MFERRNILKRNVNIGKETNNQIIEILKKTKRNRYLISNFMLEFSQYRIVL